MDIYFFILIILLVSYCSKIIFDSRDICFFSQNNTTDNEKMVRMASEINIFDWPSRMHKIPYGRGQLREFWVLGLKLISYFQPKKISDFRNVTLGAISHSLSALMIYIISMELCDPKLALFISLFYITSVWGTQVVLYLGHVILAQLFFLISVFLIVIFFGSYPDQYWLIALSGFFSIVSFCSSSASRKFPLMLLYIFVLFQANTLRFRLEGNTIYFVVAVVLSYLILILFKKWISQTLVKLINQNLSLNLREEKINKYHQQLEHWMLKAGNWVTFALLFCFIFVDSQIFYFRFLYYFLGIILGLSLILLPNFFENSLRYIEFLGIGKWANHFKAYPDHEKTFGKKLPDEFRGGGIEWVLKFFADVIPIPFILFLVCLIYCSYSFLGGELIAVLVLSIMPTAVSEYTKSLQVGKSYFPSFIGFLIFITWSFSKLGFHDLMFSLVILNFLHFIYYYRKDILPCRLAASNLRNELIKLNIKTFYTYENTYNDSLVRSMEYQFPGEFEIIYVKQIADILKEGSRKSDIFVIPSTSSKGVQMETQQFAILNGDFRLDQKLNELFENKEELERITLARIPTMATSKFYVHESEITSYRSLILKQVAKKDRWLGIARVVKFT